MDKLYGWEARRAGGRITITHSCGKIAGINSIAADMTGKIVALHHDGRSFELHIPGE